MNELDTRVLNAAERLELAVKASTEAAQRLLKCAESISNPIYSITMGGKAFEILAVQHFQGQINIQVKSNLNDLDPRHPRKLSNISGSDATLVVLDEHGNV